jgi:hypothetical protein
VGGLALGVSIWDSRIAWHIFRALSVPVGAALVLVLVLGGMVVTRVERRGKTGRRDEDGEERGFIGLLFWRMLEDVGDGSGRWDLAVSGGIVGGA